MTAKNIVERFISFFEKRRHKRIPNSSLILQDPTTLFTSSGMQPLVSYLLGEPHPRGKRLVNVQNCFRAQDIDEIGDNRHTTFFRMLGNWSLGDYFKKEQLPWFFEFLTSKREGLSLDPKRLYITVFKGYNKIPKDEESIAIWKELFAKVGIDAKEGERIFSYGVDKNWWSRGGMPVGMSESEPGGPDSEVFYEFTQLKHNPKFGEKCHPNCNCGKFLEIGNSVFMEYQKQKDGSFKRLSQQNVDFGGGLERLLAAVEDKQDIFETSLFVPIINSIEIITGKDYQDFQKQMRIIADHLIATVFIVDSGISPSNKEQGYLLRRLIRRAFDSINEIRGIENMVLPTRKITESIIVQYKATDPQLETNFEKILNTILEEINNYRFTLTRAQRFIKNKYKIGDELKGTVEISSEDVFQLYTSHGLSPTQIKSLGFIFNEQEFSEKIKEHQNKSRAGAKQKFAG